MSSTKHREVAKLDRVPLPVEAARIGVTGWQLTRTGARVVTKLAGHGSAAAEGHQADSRRPSPTWAPPTSSSARSSRPARARSASSCRREFRSLLDRVPPADTGRGAQAVRRGARRRPGEAVRQLRRGAVRLGVDRPGALRHPAQRRGGRGQDPAAGHPPPGGRRPADPQALRASSSSWPSWAAGCPPKTWSPTSPTTWPRS